MLSQMKVVSSEYGLKWSGLKWMVSSEVVSIVCTPNCWYSRTCK